MRLSMLRLAEPIVREKKTALSSSFLLNFGPYCGNL
jgi:hypothetical protein